MSECYDTLLSDFRDDRFREAFKQYFGELQLWVKDWEALFAEMEEDGGNLAFVRRTRDGETVGFIQFKPLVFSSAFFEETCGFIREFWVAGGCRRMGHGSALLDMAEGYFLQHGIYTAVLTTDTAVEFYEKRGYQKALGCRAKNKMDVFAKRLRPAGNGV